MRLFHYTAISNLPSILRCGYIDTTDSNLRILNGPDVSPVVWLSSNPSSSAEVQKWGQTSISPRRDGSPELERRYARVMALANKARVRIVIEIATSPRDPRMQKEPACYSWDHWSRCLGREKKFSEALMKSGGDWRSWYVSEYRILPRNWVRIEDTQTGAILWNGEGVTPEGQQLLDEYSTDIELLPLYRFTASGWSRA